MRELPAGWCYANVADVGDVGGGLTLNSSKRSASKHIAPLLSVAAVQFRHIKIAAASTIGLTPEDGDKGRLEAGDLLVVEGNGSVGQIGRVAIWREQIADARHQNHLIRIRPRVVSEYLLEWLASAEGRRAIVSGATSVSGLYNLNLAKVSALPVPVPPLAEQRRIVAKIDELFARTRKAKEALDRIPPLLDKLKKAILAAAFRGDLTKEWRRSAVTGKREGVVARGQDGPTTLPPEWVWLPFNAIFDVKGGTQPPKSEFSDKPLPGYVRLLQIRDFASEEHPVYIKDAARWSKCEEEDVMIARYGASLGRILTGKAGAYNVALVRLIRLRNDIHLGWCRYLLESDWFQGPLKSVSRSAQDGFNKDELGPRLLPVAPAVEQVVIAGAVAAAMQTVDTHNRLVAAARHRLTSLESAILAKAFRGELVPQDPNDEPASVLLERIRAERAAAPATKKTRGRPKAAVPAKPASRLRTSRATT